jgi:GR25 family glycosyltransferase involved in LPS biosynthesis
MSERFNKLNLEVSRFKATTPEDLSEESDTLFNISTLEKCCTQSHMRLWKHAQELNLDYVFILEDDACFDKGWRQKLNEIKLDENWDAIFLNVFNPIEPRDEWKIIYKQCLTGGYILSKKGINRILNLFKNNDYRADWMTEVLQNDGNSYSYYPWLIIQDGFESTLDGNYNYNHEKVLYYLNDSGYSIDNYLF